MKTKKERKPLNKKAALMAIIILIVAIIVLTSTYFSMKYANTPIEEFRDSILALMENINDYEVKDEYVLINFPDKAELIVKNGKIKNSSGKKYKEFKDGYVIKYKDGTYAFRLSDGAYCGIKNFNDTGVEIDVFEPCTNYEVVYRKVEE